jgi:hypothetical protein
LRKQIKVKHLEPCGVKGTGTFLEDRWSLKLPSWIHFMVVWNLCEWEEDIKQFLCGLKDSLDREYNFRRVRKSAVQYIQKVAFKDKPVEEQFENTLAEDLMKDLYTASHPYAFMAVPTLAEAVR